MNTNVLADSKYHRADVDGILPPCYVIAFPQLSSPTHSNFGVHEPQEEATEAQLNNEYWQKRLLRLQGAHVAGPRAASPFSTSTPEFVMHKMHKCVAEASLHLSLYAYISCVNMCVCTGSVALAACTEEDTGEEGQQEELERLYSTIYQLDAQVYRKV
jgi:hypothetical protein